MKCAWLAFSRWTGLSQTDLAYRRIRDNAPAPSDRARFAWLDFRRPASPSRARDVIDVSRVSKTFISKLSPQNTHSHSNTNISTNNIQNRYLLQHKHANKIHFQILICCDTNMQIKFKSCHIMSVNTTISSTTAPNARKLRCWPSTSRISVLTDRLLLSSDTICNKRQLTQ